MKLSTRIETVSYLKVHASENVRSMGEEGLRSSVYHLQSRLNSLEV